MIYISFRHVKLWDLRHLKPKETACTPLVVYSRGDCSSRPFGKLVIFFVLWNDED
jgi:hypothetical protein